MQGPNFIWHLDGYDKLTPYGLTIHGCIDGWGKKFIDAVLYSATCSDFALFIIGIQGKYYGWKSAPQTITLKWLHGIIWNMWKKLQVIDNNSYVSSFLSVTSYRFRFLVLSGCPAIVRSDYGTENCYLASIQVGFRLAHDDTLRGERSFIYGPSKHNVVCLVPSC